MRQGNLYLCGAGLVGNHVQITFRIWLGEIRGGGQHAVAQGQHRGYRFDRSRRSQRVPVHGLGGTDGKRSGVAAEDRMDGRCLHAVIGLGRGSVGIDVANLLRS